LRNSVATTAAQKPLQHRHATEAQAASPLALRPVSKNHRILTPPKRPKSPNDFNVDIGAFHHGFLIQPVATAGDRDTLGVSHDVDRASVVVRAWVCDAATASQARPLPPVARSSRPAVVSLASATTVPAANFRRGPSLGNDRGKPFPRLPNVRVALAEAAMVCFAPATTILPVRCG